MNKIKDEIFIAGLHFARMQLAADNIESNNSGGSYTNTGVGAGSTRLAAIQAKTKLLELVKKYDEDWT